METDTVRLHITHKDWLRAKRLVDKLNYERDHYCAVALAARVLDELPHVTPNYIGTWHGSYVPATPEDQRLHELVVMRFDKKRAWPFPRRKEVVITYKPE